MTWTVGHWSEEKPARIWALQITTSTGFGLRSSEWHTIAVRRGHERPPSPYVAVTHDAVERDEDWTNARSCRRRRRRLCSHPGFQFHQPRLAAPSSGFFKSRNPDLFFLFPASGVWMGCTTQRDSFLRKKSTLPPLTFMKVYFFPEF